MEVRRWGGKSNDLEYEREYAMKYAANQRSRGAICTLAMSASLLFALSISGAARAYDVIEVPDGGTIKGVATWKGEIPKDRGETEGNRGGAV